MGDGTVDGGTAAWDGSETGSGTAPDGGLEDTFDRNDTPCRCRTADGSGVAAGDGVAGAAAADCAGVAGRIGACAEGGNGVPASAGPAGAAGTCVTGLGFAVADCAANAMSEDAGEGPAAMREA